MTERWPERVESVLLDAGGVLLDLDYEYFRRLIAARHGEVSIEELARYEAAARREIHRQVSEGGRVSETWRDYFRIMLSKAGVAVEEHEDIVDSLWEAHQRFGLWTVAIDGAIETVSLLKERGLRIGVVSNAEGRVEQDLEAAGFRGLFETVVDSHLVGVEKPDPKIFRIAMERMNLAPEGTIYVGDLPSVDVVGARAADIAAVLIDRHDLYPEADARRVASIRELPSLIGLEKAD
jgi:putative hydrolase of the HAD superfamily